MTGYWPAWTENGKSQLIPNCNAQFVDRLVDRVDARFQRVVLPTTKGHLSGTNEYVLGSKRVSYCINNHSSGGIR